MMSELLDRLTDSIKVLNDLYINPQVSPFTVDSDLLANRHIHMLLTIAHLAIVQTLSQWLIISWLVDRVYNTSLFSLLIITKTRLATSGIKL
jgi:hypothetical protein